MPVDIIRERQHLFLGSRLKRLAEQMQGDVVLVAHQAGIPIQPGQYPLLVILEEHGPTTIGELARAMRMSQPAITKSASKLEEAGLVTIGRGDTDRRQSTVSLSRVGQETLDRSKRTVWPLVEAAVKEAIDGLSGPFLDQIPTLKAIVIKPTVVGSLLSIDTPFVLSSAYESSLGLPWPERCHPHTCRRRCNGAGCR